ncbi:alpha/beta hydrolase [Acaricomes phytoseiuli]|uniref:alpha/beta hydrolase n=1 Tax=Acaricomes phytoseiuli TaxID=291968 RepID=UPI00035ECCAB|nr:alpha/beta hydrolase [Acaricomes phytoseiuli]
MQAQDELDTARQQLRRVQEEAIDASGEGAPLIGLALRATLAVAPGVVDNAFLETRFYAAIDEAQNLLEALRRRADDLRERYRAESDRVAAQLVITPASDALAKAGLEGDIPVGAGSLAALLAPSAGAKLDALVKLRDRIDAGDDFARAEYLSALSALSPARLALYQMRNQGQARNPLAVARTAEEVAWVRSWWQRLGVQEQGALILMVPGIIGNLNGISYRQRAQANRINMENILADPKTSDDVRTALGAVRNKPQDRDGKLLSDRALISLDLQWGGKPLGAIAIGDMDTAINVTWNIPGMGTTLADGIDSWTDSALDLYEAQVYAGQILNKADGNLAVVSWIGYETPDKPGSLGTLDVGLTDQARAGGDRLAAALDGFRDTRSGGSAPLPSVNLLAHSYGTMASADALMKVRYSVDTVTFFGSAGIDSNQIENAAALKVAKTPEGSPAVYVTQASADRVAPLGVGTAGALSIFPGLGGYRRHSPSDDWFGGINFSSEGGLDPQTGEYLKPTNGQGLSRVWLTVGVWGDQAAFASV